MSGTVETKRDQVRRILQLPPAASTTSQDGATRELEAAITAYLRRATETFDLSKNVEVSRLYYSVSVGPAVVLGNSSTVPVFQCSSVDILFVNTQSVQSTESVVTRCTAIPAKSQY